MYAYQFIPCLEVSLKDYDNCYSEETRLLKTSAEISWVGRVLGGLDRQFIPGSVAHFIVLRDYS